MENFASDFEKVCQKLKDDPSFGETNSVAGTGSWDVQSGLVEVAAFKSNQPLIEAIERIIRTWGEKSSIAYPTTDDDEIWVCQFRLK